MLASSILLQTSAAQADGPKISFKIPVRFNLLPMYLSTTQSFEGYKTDIRHEGPAIGGEFEVPIPPLNTMLGISGFYSYQKDGDITDNMSFLAFYVGASMKAVDVIFGPGVAPMARTIRGTSALPDERVYYYGIPKGGFIGLRKYFVTKGMSGFAIGITGYYAEDSKYEKTTTTGMTPTKTTVNEKVKFHGGTVQIGFTFGETRQTSIR
jgi:hypothetical protein